MKLFQDGALRDFGGVKYLFVDDFDEMTYQAFSFVKALSQKLDEYYIAVDANGGARRGYLSAYPDGYKFFESEIFELNVKDDDAEKILQSLEGQSPQKLSQFEFCPVEQYMEMTEKILQRLSGLLHEGVKPCDISLVMPENDFVLKHHLEQFFVQNGLKYQFLSGTRRLYDDKFVFASITVLCLVHPEWGVRVQDTELKRFLVEFLGLPAVLCDTVASHYKKHSQLPLGGDFGDEVSDYADFIVLTEELKAKDISLCDELQFVFKNCILERATEADTFSFFNQLFASLDDFENLYARMSSEIPYRDWVLQVKSSIVADNPPDTMSIIDDGIIISSPQKIIDCEVKTKYQLWVDAKNRNWLKDDAGRIYNSWVLQKSFEEDEYTQEMHRALTLKKSGHLLRKLKYLCQKVLVFSSNFGVEGAENQGELLRFLVPPEAVLGAKSIVPRDDQKPVLDYSGGKMAVPAVPGAGKTTIMQALIMKLIDDGVSPSAILVLTYMESAAKNFLSRIKSNYPHLAEYPHVSTLHAFAYKIIADGDNAHRVGLDSTFEVCDEAKNSVIMNKICLDNLPAGEDFADWVDYCRGNISRAKTLLLAPDFLDNFIRKNPKEAQMAEFARVYRIYDKQMKRQNLVDYDDLLILAHRLLSEHADIRAFYQDKFAYIVEDEAQDSSKIQQELIAMIAAKSGNIVRCGDVNQAIMSTFTNSDVCGFKEFIEEAKTVEMTSSQRCSAEIYELANSLVSWAKKSDVYKDAFYDIKMQPVVGGNPTCSECINFASLGSENEEQEYVLAQVKELFAQDKNTSVAILLRNNYQIRNWINFLERHGVEVLCRADAIKEKRVFKLILAALKFVDKPLENKYLVGLAVAFNQCNLARIPHHSVDFIKKLKESLIRHEEVLHSAKELDNDAVYAFWWDAFYFLNKSFKPVSEFVLEFGRYYFDKKQDLANVSLISSMIKRFEQGFLREEEKEASLSDVVAYLDQIGKSRSSKYFEDEESKGVMQVEIMTLHKAKGDEFDAVFVPHFVDRHHKIDIEKIELKRDDSLALKLESLAGKASVSPAEKKQEVAFESLRLIYVAITRAKRKLYFVNGSPQENDQILKLLQKLACEVQV